MALTTCIEPSDNMAQLGDVQMRLLAPSQDGAQREAHALGTGISIRCVRLHGCTTTAKASRGADGVEESTRSGSSSLASRLVRAVAAWATRLEGFASCTPDAAAWVRETALSWLADMGRVAMHAPVSLSAVAVDADTRAMLW